MFIRIKVDKSGRMYLYEEERHREGPRVVPKSRSLGRVETGIFFIFSILADMLQTKVNGIDHDEAERQSLQAQERQRAEDERHMWEITHPGWESPGVPEKPTTSPAADHAPAPGAPDDASPAEPGEQDAPDPDAADGAAP